MIDSQTSSQIDRLVERVLRDTACEPPISLDNVLRYLEVDLTYYNLDDPGFIRRFAHRAKLRGQSLAHQIARIARKVKLHALWCPDEDQIFVDQSLPLPKKKWASYHDTIHRLLPWHRAFFCWDTAQTLDPAYQEMLEAEANYGASALMFCGRQFTEEALDTVPTWASVRMLSVRHRASLTTTLRRYVKHSHERPMVAIVSTPRWLQAPEGRSERVRHVDTSSVFLREFGVIAPPVFGALIEANTVFASGGPVGQFSCALPDLRGEERRFRVECFFNRHDLLTLFVEYRVPSSNVARKARVPASQTDIGGSRDTP